MYCFVRRKGYPPEVAEDLTQTFFASFLEKNLLRFADQERGKFRSFLLTAVKNFLIHQWQRSNAAKRGGGIIHVSWDQALAEERYQLEAAHELSPEKAFDQDWALTLFQGALARLREEYESAGKIEQFEQLKNYLSEEAGGYSRAASLLGMTTSTVAVAVYRLRQRYGQLVREEIAQTIENPRELQEELRYLIDLASA